LEDYQQQAGQKIMLIIFSRLQKNRRTKRVKIAERPFHFEQSGDQALVRLED
jgi:hypothetical protein